MSETSTSTNGSPDFEIAQQGLFERVMPKVWRMASILPIPAQAGFSSPSKIFVSFSQGVSNFPRFRAPISQVNPVFVRAYRKDEGTWNELEELVEV